MIPNLPFLPFVDLLPHLYTLWKLLILYCNSSSSLKTLRPPKDSSDQRSLLFFGVSSLSLLCSSLLDMASSLYAALSTSDDSSPISRTRQGVLNRWNSLAESTGSWTNPFLSRFPSLSTGIGSLTRSSTATTSIVSSRGSSA